MKHRVPGSHNVLAYKQRIGRFLWAVFRLGILIGIAYVILYPLFLKLSIAFMSKKDMYDMTVKWIPRYPTWDNFKQAIELLNYGEYFRNTLLLSAGVTLIQMVSCTLTAYGFARFRFRGNKILFFFVIFMLIVPPQTYTTASYAQFVNFNFFGLLGPLMNISLINTPWPVLILSLGCAGLKNGLFIYILRQFFMKLPNELEASAHVDGAGVFRIFYSIMLPNAVPALTTVGIFSFVWTWNDLYSATTYMPGMKLFPLALANLTGKFQSAMDLSTMPDMVSISTATNAAALLIILPLILFFFITQRFFVEGIERTGLTGM